MRPQALQERCPFIDDDGRCAGRRRPRVVPRPGAITVSEICAAGGAPSLVPLVVSTTSTSVTTHASLAQHGAGIHLPQEELSARRSFTRTERTQPPQLALMGNKAQALAAPGGGACGG